MEGMEEGAKAAGSGMMGSMVPWNQIPGFTPGETDVFLRELWPVDFLDQLAPRAAMSVEGVAFQKVSRLDPERLKSKDGVWRPWVENGAVFKARKNLTCLRRLCS